MATASNEDQFSFRFHRTITGHPTSPVRVRYIKQGASRPRQRLLQRDKANPVVSEGELRQVVVRSCQFAVKTDYWNKIYRDAMCGRKHIHPVAHGWMANECDKTWTTPTRPVGRVGKQEMGEGNTVGGQTRSVSFTLERRNG